MKDRGVNISQRAYFVKKFEENKTHVLCPDHLPREQMIEHKYIMDIDGNACTWDATAWKLNSGSVIFKPESDWQQWFYDSFIPWKHYVPVKDDFEDVIEYKKHKKLQESINKTIANNIFEVRTDL